MKRLAHRAIHAILRRCWHNGMLHYEHTRSDYFGLVATRPVIGHFLGEVLRTQSREIESLRSSLRSSRVLQSGVEVDDAVRQLSALGLPPHFVRAKNWDALLAFSWVVSRSTTDAAVVDLGCAEYGPVLSWLHLIGYKDLHGGDLIFDRTFTRGRIRFSHQDLEHTIYPDSRFDFVVSLSVIEHGIDLDAFFREVIRILKPDGRVLISTDYWCEKVDTADKVAFGVPVRIFTPEDVRKMIDVAAVWGLELDEPFEEGCEDAVVVWEDHGLEFTFLFLSFCRATVTGSAT